jgi:hypothetical protein
MNKMAMGRSPETMIEGKCAGVERNLTQMLLEPEAAPAKVSVHVAECESCRMELEELRATTALLDSWKVAEPNPYFLTRLQARMQEERQAEPAGWRWLARWRDRYAYGQTTHLRPIAAMALTIMLLVGGGMYLGITNWDQPPVPSGQAAVVDDLQTMESNAQLLDQLEALSSPSENGD